MTQKELLYFEDAIGHLGNIVKLLNDFDSNVQNNQIKDFFNNEKSKLQNLKTTLVNVLGGKTNGWSFNDGKLFISTKE